AEDGIRDFHVTGVQTCALPISTTSGRYARWEPSRLSIAFHTVGPPPAISTERPTSRLRRRGTDLVAPGRDGRCSVPEIYARVWCGSRVACPGALMPLLPPPTW